MRFLKNCLLVALAGIVSACGGGGDSAPNSSGPSAEGAYSGTLTGGVSSDFRLLVLENGDYWALYGTEFSGQFLVTGFIQGQGVSSNPNFTSSNAKDFGVNPPVSGTIAATYVAGSSINGSASALGQTTSFSGTAIPAASFDYNSAPTITSISGNWSLTSLSGAPVSLVISGGGTFTGSSQGCSFTGTITPRPSGKNVYNLSLTFGATPCASPNSSGSGIAISYLLTSGARQLIMVGTDSSRASGTVLLGLR